MQTITSHAGGNTTISYRAERSSTIKPAIKRQFFQGKGKERTRMYETTDGRTFIAEVYDRNFVPQVKVRMLPKNHKSKSIDSRVID